MKRVIPLTGPWRPAATRVPQPTESGYGENSAGIGSRDPVQIGGDVMKPSCFIQRTAEAAASTCPPMQ